jgi:hypothetical protein
VGRFLAGGAHQRAMPIPTHLEATPAVPLPTRVKAESADGHVLMPPLGAGARRAGAAAQLPCTAASSAESRSWLSASCAPGRTGMAVRGEAPAWAPRVGTSPLVSVVPSLHSCPCALLVWEQMPEPCNYRVGGGVGYVCVSLLGGGVSGRGTRSC